MTDRFKPGTDGTAIVGSGGIKVQLQFAAREGFQHRDNQQPGCVFAESVGDEANPYRRFGCRHRVCKGELPTERRHLRVDGRGERFSAVALLTGRSIFCQKTEGRDACHAFGHGHTQLRA